MARCGWLTQARHRQNDEEQFRDKHVGAANVRRLLECPPGGPYERSSDHRSTNHVVGEAKKWAVEKNRFQLSYADQRTAQTRREQVQVREMTAIKPVVSQLWFDTILLQHYNTYYMLYLICFSYLQRIYCIHLLSTLIITCD